MSNMEHSRRDTVDVETEVWSEEANARRHSVTKGGKSLGNTCLHQFRIGRQCVLSAAGLA